MKRLLKIASIVWCACLLLAAGAGARTLTKAERKQAEKEIKAGHKELKKSIGKLTDEQLRWKPATERWSAAECAEHLIVSEELIVKLIQERIMKSPAAAEQPAAEQARLDAEVLMKIADRSRRAQAPAEIAPKARYATRAELLKALDASTASILNYVRTTQDELRTHFLPHPALGVPLDGYQWLMVDAAHFTRHTKQIEEVKADPKFPKKQSRY